MPTNPNEDDPKPVPPEEAAIPANPEENASEEVRFDELPDLGPVDLSELAGDVPFEESSPLESVWATPEPLPVPEASLPSDPSFEIPSADPASFTGGEPPLDSDALVELPEIDELPPLANPSDPFGFPEFPPEPAIPVAGEDPDAAVGNLEPPSTVSPASGWYSRSDLKAPDDEDLVANVEGSGSDLFGNPPAKPKEPVESSDIFSGGLAPIADRAETSDVLIGTDRDNAPPGHSSALSLGTTPAQNPDGSFIEQALPVEEEEVAEATPVGESVLDANEEDSDSLFDLGEEEPRVSPVIRAKTPQPSESDSRVPIANAADEGHEPSDSLFDGLDEDPQVNPVFRPKPKPVDDDDEGLAHEAGLPEIGITPDYGELPNMTPDASSILSDLTTMGPGASDHSSAVRLEAPGFERTVGRQMEGTEFDLTVPDDEAIPQELADAAAEAEGWDATAEFDASEGLFGEDHGTTPELELEKDSDSGPRLHAKRTPAEPDGTESSVPLTPAKSGSESESDVEFTDFPEAEDEAASSRVFGPLTPPKQPVPTLGPSQPDFELPGFEQPSSTALDADALDWDIKDDSDENPALPKAPATPGGRGKPNPAVPARSGRDHTDPVPTSEQRELAESLDPSKPKRKPPLDPASTTDAADDENGSVEIDWLSGSMPDRPVAGDGPVPVADWGSESSVHSGASIQLPAEEESYEVPPIPKPPSTRRPLARKSKPETTLPSPARASGGKGGWLVGTIVGMLLAGGTFAGIYFSGVIPNGEKTVAKVAPPDGQQPGTSDGNNPNKTPEVTPPDGQTTVADLNAAVRAGDAVKAKKLAAAMKDPSTTVKAAQGEAEFFAMVQERKTETVAESPELSSIRAKLQALVNDPEAAKTPEGQKAAVKAAIQLGESFLLAGDKRSAERVYLNGRERFPDHAVYFDAALHRMDITTAPPPIPMPDGKSRRLDPKHAEHLLLALILLQAPPAADDTEAGVYFWKAVTRAKNENFAEAIEDIRKAKAAHIKQAKANAGRGLNPLSDPLEQIFARSCDDLQTYWELRLAIYDNKAVADLLKKNPNDKAFAELAAMQKKAADAVKLATDLKEASDKLGVAAKDLKDAKELVTKLEKDAKAAEDAKIAIEKKLETEEKARKSADEVVAGVVKELQAAKLLPEKFDNAELLAAQKRAIDRAGGPTLASLVAPGMMAIGGAPLSSGQLIDIAERLTKSEAAVKVANDKVKAANDKLATETKKLATEHAEAMKKLADTHAETMKKLTDTHAESVKKLMDTHADALKKANDANATTVSKLKEAQTAELKKLTEKYTADMKKVADDYETKVKALDAAVLAEKKQAEAMAAKFKTELSNSISPAQALDLWLPILVELRRPSDSEGALATATKVITSAPADSEDAAKARTVAGLAMLYQNKITEAKAQFQSAKSFPKYDEALKAKKLWAMAADLGLLSITDPLIAYRQIQELPRRAQTAAARSLDAGMTAYKEGRNKDAVTALTEATKTDPANPVSWYFLGAAKWALGSLDEAKDDIRQGAVREATSNTAMRVISAALSPIQGAARDAITAVRP